MGTKLGLQYSTENIILFVYDILFVLNNQSILCS